MRNSRFGGNLVPDKVFQDIQEITPEFLCAHGILGLAVDLDNTLARYAQRDPDDDTVAWVKALQEAGFSLVVLTNNSEARGGRFCKPLGVTCVHRAGKPRLGGFRRAIKLLGLRPEQIAQVGDQVYTDVWGAKRSGMFSILVTPLHLEGHFFFSLRRKLESPFIRRALEREKSV